MRGVRCLRVALTVAAAVFVVGELARVTAAETASGMQPVALLDVSYLFEKLPHFKKAMEVVTADAQTAQNEVKQQEEAIRALAKEAEGKRGESEARALEQRITTMRGELAVRIELQRRLFQQRQAVLYHDVYKEIQEEAQKVARARGLRVILRFNGDPVDKGRPESVLLYINRPVVWYDQENDITPIVLERLIDKPRKEKPAEPEEKAVETPK